MVAIEQPRPFYVPSCCPECGALTYGDDPCKGVHSEDVTFVRWSIASEDAMHWNEATQDHVETPDDDKRMQAALDYMGERFTQEFPNAAIEVVDGGYENQFSTMSPRAVNGETGDDYEPFFDLSGEIEDAALMEAFRLFPTD